MGWIKVDDSFYDNEKMLAVGSIGRDMYWHGMGYCNRNLTDGLIPKGRAMALVDYTDAAVLVGMGGVDGQECAPIAIARLIEENLWHEDGHDCPSCAQPGPRHYIVHDYLKYQFSKAQIEEKAEANKKRVDAWRRRNADGNAVGNALQTPLLTEHVHDNPNPNPNPNTSLVTKGGRVALVDARENPPPHCSRHEENSETPCRACKARREWEAGESDRRKADELLARRLAKERSENCPICHGTNWIPDTDPAVKCLHEVAARA